MKSSYQKERRKKKYTTLLYLLEHTNFTAPETWQAAEIDGQNHKGK